MGDLLYLDTNALKRAYYAGGEALLRAYVDYGASSGDVVLTDVVRMELGRTAIGRDMRSILDSYVGTNGAITNVYTSEGPLYAAFLNGNAPTGYQSKNAGDRSIIDSASQEQLAGNNMTKVSLFLGMVTLLFAVLGLSEGAGAEDNSQNCSNTFTFFNRNAKFEAFDRREGGKDQRLEFRLSGTEPCSEHECRLDIIRKASKLAARSNPAQLAMGDRIIASVDLNRRSPSYCVVDLERVAVIQPLASWDTKPVHQQLRKSCPDSYLSNSLVIKFDGDSDGPYLKRWIEIKYVYRPDGSDIDLDWCETPTFVDGAFRREGWTVPVADGAAVAITEIDSPKEGRGPLNPHLLSSGDHPFFESPYAVTVFGARERNIR